MLKPNPGRGPLLAPQGPGADRENARRHKRMYEEFAAAPGEKCARCWMLAEHCFCAALPDPALRHELVLYSASKEVARHAASNTGKLVLLWGGALVCEGVEEDEAWLAERIREAEHPVVLFPASGAVRARDVGGKQRLLVVVLDGSWKDAKRLNARVDARVPRVCLTEVDACSLRTTLGATRKYGECARVQTAPAVVQLLRELGDDATGAETGCRLAIERYAQQNCAYALKIR